MSVKRAAIADSKTGMPVFQPYSHQGMHLSPAQHHIALAQHPAMAINYPGINFAQVPYQVPYTAAFPIHCKFLLSYLISYFAFVTYFLRLEIFLNFHNSDFDGVKAPPQPPEIAALCGALVCFGSSVVSFIDSQGQVKSLSRNF